MQEPDSRLTVALAPDSFKGSLSSPEVVAAMTDGLVDVYGDTIRIIALPLADGGEGTLDALLASWSGIERRVTTVDAIGRPAVARYGLSADGKTAIIEAAQANGLPKVSDVAFQPLRADSYGVGLIALDALEHNVDKILLCIGGSASSDGGTGLLRALGVRFLTANGDEVSPGGGDLARIVNIDISALHPRAREVKWSIAVDVSNPLTGTHGAAATFGPQKGATPGDVAVLDQALSHLDQVLRTTPGLSPLASDTPGTGAAGGLPLTAVTILGADLVIGADLISEAVDLQNHLASADLVITGEGSFDSQSLRGKVVDLVRRTAPHDVPIVVIAGRVELSTHEMRDAGITAAFSLAAGPESLETLISNAAARVRETTANVAATVAAFTTTAHPAVVT